MKKFDLDEAENEFFFVLGNELDFAEQAYKAGNLYGLLEGLELCLITSSKLPQWLAFALISHLKDELKEDADRISSEEKHYWAYFAVREAMSKGIKGAAKWMCAQERLEALGINLAPETIEKYHDVVRSALNTDEGRIRYRRYLSPLGRSDALSRLEKKRGSKKRKLEGSNYEES